MTIILYDIPSTNPENFWSPNTLKARIALLYKGIPLQTEWVEYPDIEPTLKKIGAAPTSKNPDGSDLYTLPVIHDTSNGKVISDSMLIAEYLDDQYPDKPSLFPYGARAPIRVFNTYFLQTAAAHARPIVLSESCYKLNPPSEAYFRRTRELSHGMRIEEFAPPGPKREAIWEATKAGYAQVAAQYGKNKEGPFFYGKTFSYADVIVVAYLLYAKIVLGAESSEWKAAETWDDGRWGELLQLTKAYQVPA